MKQRDVNALYVIAIINDIQILLTEVTTFTNHPSLIIRHIVWKLINSIPLAIQKNISIMQVSDFF